MIANKSEAEIRKEAVEEHKKVEAMMQAMRDEFKSELEAGLLVEQDGQKFRYSYIVPSVDNPGKGYERTFTLKIEVKFRRSYGWNETRNNETYVVRRGSYIRYGDGKPSELKYGSLDKAIARVRKDYNEARDQANRDIANAKSAVEHTEAVNRSKQVLNDRIEAANFDGFEPAYESYDDKKIGIKRFTYGRLSVFAHHKDQDEFGPLLLKISGVQGVFTVEDIRRLNEHVENLFERDGPRGDE